MYTFFTILEPDSTDQQRFIIRLQEYSVFIITMSSQGVTISAQDVTT